MEIGTHKALMDQKEIYYGLQKASGNQPETANINATTTKKMSEPPAGLA